MITSDADFKRIDRTRSIFLYGAKSIANTVYNILEENACPVEGFLVSRTLGNPDSVKGLPVRLVYDMLDRKKEICTIVAVLPRYRKEVVEQLLQLGFSNIITLSDRYADELKRQLDEEGKFRFMEGTGYILEIPEGVENAHGILRRQGAAQGLKWRVDIRTLDQLRAAALSGQWKNDGLTKEYEQLYGVPEQCPEVLNESRNPADPQEAASVYVVKCHVDKPIKEYVLPGYLREIQAGAALTEQRICACADNTGDNISHKNRDFSEASAIYWIWKNGIRKEYTGVYHYRRHLDISAEELRRQMEKGTELINTVPCLMYPSNKYFFVTRFIYEYDWLLMMEMIHRLKPGYYETARKFESGHFYLANNIFVMKTEWFDRMCGFVFPILLEIDRQYTERNIERQDRYAGFLFEILYSVFVMYHAKEMKIAYADMRYLN